MISEKDLSRIARLRACDDDFARLLFKNKEVTEYVLSIFLKRKISVVKNYTQYDLKNINGSSAIVDVYAIDSDGVYYDIEIQNNIDGAIPKRARLISSLMDSNLKSGKYGSELPKSYVIFYLDNDYFGYDEPYYLFTSKCLLENKIIELSDDRYIMYVNMKYNGNDSFGKLNKDFKEINCDLITESPLREEIAKYKESEKEMLAMCDIWKEVKQEGIVQGKASTIEEFAKKFILEGKADEYIASFTELSIERVKEIRKEMTK